MITADDDYPLVDLAWTFVLFFGLLACFGLVITVFGDLFRRRDVSGWGKAGRTVLVLLVPLIGSLTYLVTQGRRPTDRDVRQARPRAADHGRTAARSHGVDEIVRAQELLDEGAISQEEFEELKRHALV